MELHLVVITISMMGILVVGCYAQLETEEELCELACEICIDRSKAFERMGCFEKCLAEGFKHFTCPGDKSFLSHLNPPSPRLKEEVEEYFRDISAMASAKKFKGLVETFYTTDSMLVVDREKPVIGRVERAKKWKDFFFASPEIDRVRLYAIDFGEENGVIWVNGVSANYDKQNNLLSSFKMMCFLRRVGEDLQEFMQVLF